MRGEQLARQWRLIQRLAHSRVGVDLDALADELDCVRRTVYRDLDALMLAGFPVVSEKRDGRVLYRFIETFRMGDVPFSPDELLAMVLSEDLLRVLEGTVFHDSILSAQAKIRAGLGPELAGYVERLGETFRVMPGPHKQYAQFRDVIAQLSDAVLDRRTLRMRYRTGRTGTVATRDLDPYRVWYRSGGLYVIGRDHKSDEIRTFAVERIQRLDRTDLHFEIPEDFDFDTYTAASFGVMTEPATRVRLRFTAEWAIYIEERTWHPSQSIVKRKDGSVDLTLDVGGTPELRSWILSFGSGALVLEPEELRAVVAAEHQRALSRYRPERKPTARRQPAARI